MLVVVNPHATTVSDRLKNLVVYALQGRYDVEAVSTQAQNHATEIGREAIDGGFDVVVAFGGDGTLNEIANGLAGTDIPVGLLPGGAANVVSRTLGVPPDVVDATEHLLSLADDFHPRRIDLGVANGRRFLFACGAGLDASTAKRVDARPALKSRGGPWFYASVAISSFYADYVRDPVRLRLEADGGEAEGVTAIAQNSDPYTYFGGRPIHICEGVALDNGTLSIAVLRRAAARDLPGIAARIVHPSLDAPGHRQIEHFAGVTEGRVIAMSRDRDGAIRSFPVQVDGDYIGDHGELDLGIEPGALMILA
jgi:diacylglycerol kinase family enzyme